MKLALTLALALVAGAALADPLPQLKKPSIHTPPHRSLMRQHLNPWNVNAPQNTDQKARRTQQQHRP
jgi:hypothetical protein